jgi:gliding motility-associated-like protein
MKQQVKIVSVILLLTFSFLSKISAQLCNGSLGDPVVNITFGSGPNPGGSLGGSTNYNYVPNDCPNDGSYTIGNASNNCFNSTWYTVPEDHTPGDVNGYMMVINASFNPGDFFVQKVDGLCPNTTYEFAAWILNILKTTACQGAGIKPNITFSIETTSGTVLQSYQTGDIAAKNTIEWKQYGFFFSTTTGVSSVVLRMTNNAPGGCGNDLLLDDITFRACGPLISASIAASTDLVDVCTGDNSVFTLQANVSAGYNDPVYQWQLSTNNGASWTNIPGATNATYIRPAVTATGNYMYRFAVSERSNMNISSCSIASNVVAITVNKFPVVAATNRGNCTGDTLFLNANDGVSYSWTGPLNFSSTSQSPFILNAVPRNSGKYYVKVTSAKGCVSIDSTIADITAAPIVNAGNDIEICEDRTVQLNSTGTNITAYQWSPVVGISNANIPNPVAQPSQTTLYILTVANNNCRSSDSVMITVNRNPKADAGPDKVIIAGESVVLDGVAGGTDISYTWSPPEYITSVITLNPTINPPATKSYTLKVISNKGCGVATDNVLVKVYKELFVPNAFTPNGDGINDTWHIETLEAYPNAEVKVYNRYGEIVFTNSVMNKYWEGKFKGVSLPAGAYAYIIDLKINLPLIKGVVFIIL